jgi:hypothetical protein
MHAMLAAALTAIVIIGVGVAVLAFTRRSGATDAATAAAATERTTAPATSAAPPVIPAAVVPEPAMLEPAPPATGTAQTTEAPPSELASAAVAPSVPNATGRDAAAGADASR